MIETILIIIAGFGFIILITAGYAIGTYNFFQSYIQNIKTQWSNIKTEYQRRYDLFINLAEAVKSYKKHEKSTLLEVIKLRGGIEFKGDIKSQMKKMNSLDKFFSKLSVVFERYPELKSNEQHNILMNEVRITEDRLNIARTDYNDIVREYNTKIKVFPSSIIAGMFHFKIAIYFVNEEASNIAPKLAMD